MVEFWAILGYVILALSLFVIIYRVLNLKKQKKYQMRKLAFLSIRLMSIRTPLTLIKAPLEELFEKESFSDRGKKG